MMNKIGEVEVKSGSIFLCDMRMGPTEDGIKLKVKNRVYKVYENRVSDGLFSYFILENENIRLDRIERTRKRIPSEMGVFGLLDQDQVKEEFNGDVGEVFEWVDSGRSELFTDRSMNIETPRKNNIISFFVAIDEVDVNIDVLTYEDQPVGFEVFIAPENELATTIDINDLYCFVLNLSPDEKINIILSKEYDDESLHEEVAMSIVDYYHKFSKLLEFDSLDMGEEIYLINLPSVMTCETLDISLCKVDENGDNHLIDNSVVTIAGCNIGEFGALLIERLMSFK